MKRATRNFFRFLTTNQYPSDIKRSLKLVIIQYSEKNGVTKPDCNRFFKEERKKTKKLLKVAVENTTSPNAGQK